MALTKQERNAAFREWLSENDIFNMAKICRRLKYNRGNFAHFEDGAVDLSDRALTQFENFFKKYGYKI